MFGVPDAYFVVLYFKDVVKKIQQKSSMYTSQFRHSKEVICLQVGLFDRIGFAKAMVGMYTKL